MITLLCPTYGRPQLCKRMVESAWATADAKPQILLGIGGEDTAETCPENFYGYSIPGVEMILAWKFPAPHVLNMLAKHADYPLLMIVGDDAVFATPGWDTAIIEHYKSLKDKRHVYSLRDSRDENGTPHPIVTRAFMEELGYLAPPIFLHWYVDTWLVEIAKATRRFTHLKDYMLVHDKPSDHGNPDHTHNRIRAMGWRERDKKTYETCLRYLQADIDKVLS